MAGCRRERATGSDQLFDSADVASDSFVAPDYQGCGFNDPGQSYTQGRSNTITARATVFCSLARINPGNGLPNQANDVYAIGYYGQSDLPFLGAAGPAFTVCDNYFCGIMAETYPNRFYMHAAQTDRLTNTSTTSTLPTIWDRLQAAGYSGRYYFSDLPFLALWGTKYVEHLKAFQSISGGRGRRHIAKCGRYVDPGFAGETTDTSNDDHPHGDIRDGEAFLNQIYNAVIASPNWSKTVLIINFDEWGGFFDHVPPPLAPIPPASAAAGMPDGRLGFRVPCLVISPYARRNFIAHDQYDHTSILKMIEWRFGLPPLTVRDQTANNLADVLNFGAPDISAPTFTVPMGPFGKPCSRIAVASAPKTRRNLSLKLRPSRAGFQGVR